MKRFLIKEDYNTLKVIDNKYQIWFYTPKHHFKNPTSYHLYVNKKYLQLEYNVKINLNNKEINLDDLFKTKIEDLIKLIIEIKLGNLWTGFTVIFTKQNYNKQIIEQETTGFCPKILIGGKNLEENQQYLYCLETKCTYYSELPNEIAKELRIVPLNKFYKEICRITNKYYQMISTANKEIKMLKKM
ncbi:hypothetical protein crov023 [Cafeteria roenbergensis virus]|uniref:Uncharacterized protein n=1 Tax=Cafeteria roenbergensis virus (strain BV-PW1) TaxID=693272 RepID=E3T4E3_CROVB|nr:hypothetical protein crov023 [Cafeteria roenbergensis virus BV-PW1]ADO67056.1 hypothetical protein crov023 [Cafeteria roenbergensis virus BV-PW1]